MQLWRISNYANLLGERALHYPARWHVAGRRVVYLAASPAGALIEVLVHLQLDDSPPPERYQLLEVSAPDSVEIEDLVPGHNSAEPCQLDTAVTRGLGSAWLRSARTALAKVPSAILPSTWNFLLNPSHAEATLVQVKSVMSAKHDARLFRALR